VRAIPRQAEVFPFESIPASAEECGASIMPHFAKRMQPTQSSEKIKVRAVDIDLFAASFVAPANLIMAPNYPSRL